MKHNLNLKPEQYAQFNNGCLFLVTKSDPLFEVGDAIILSEDGTRNQMERVINCIETEGVFKGHCIIGFEYPGTRLMAARGIPPDVVTLDRNEVLPPFSTLEKEVGDE